MIWASGYYLKLFCLFLFASVGVSQYDSRDRRPPVRRPSTGPTSQIPITRFTSPPPPPNLGSTSTSKAKFTPVTKKGISIEEQLISLSNVTKASELFTKLGASLPGDGDSEGGGDRMRQRPGRQSFTDQASCEPELHTIDLSNYTHTLDDTDVVVFPRCIRVPRCGGCCGPSNLLSCMPTRISMREVRRALVKLTPVNGNRRESTVLETIQVEQHDSCSCQCREKESDCDAVKHRYSPDKCKCICVNSLDQESCTHAEKWWDPRNCACKCRNVLFCSTGLVFSHQSCTCEIEPSS